MLSRTKILMYIKHLLDSFQYLHRLCTTKSFVTPPPPSPSLSFFHYCTLLKNVQITNKPAFTYTLKFSLIFLFIMIFHKNVSYLRQYIKGIINTYLHKGIINTYLSQNTNDTDWIIIRTMHNSSSHLPDYLVFEKFKILMGTSKCPLDTLYLFHYPDVFVWSQ